MRSKAGKGRLLRLLVVGAKGILMVISAWFALFAAVGDRVANLGYVNAAGFQWGLVSFLAGLFLLARRRWIWGIAGALLGGAIMSIGIGTGLGVSQRSEAGSGTTLRVVSASLRTLNPDMRSAASTLLRTNGDVFAIQEARDPQRLLLEVQRQSGRSWKGAVNGSTLILSRFPVEVKERPHEMLKVRLQISPGRSLSLWTLRAPKDYARPYALRRYFNGLAERIQAEKPDIVAGDFNSTPWNDGYRIVAEQLTDGFRSGGIGPGFTFPTSARRMGSFFPLVRIDHIFVGPEVKVLASFVSQASPGADHFPVVTDVEFSPR